MTVQQVIELIIGAGGVTGGIKAITTLTRLTVAVEGAVKGIAAIVEDHNATKDKVDKIESRLDKGGL